MPISSCEGCCAVGKHVDLVQLPCLFETRTGGYSNATTVQSWTVMRGDTCYDAGMMPSVISFWGATTALLQGEGSSPA